jgi:hypothetical protein
MRSGILRYLVILLLLWGCVDDLVVSTANNDPADDAATSDNDQYLPSSAAAPFKSKTLATVPLRGLAVPLYSSDTLAPLGASHWLLQGNCYRPGVNLHYTLMSLQC